MKFSHWLILLKLCVSVTLAARGWLTWQWDSPIRGLIWMEDWWSGTVQVIGRMTWEEFAASSDPGITLTTTTIGLILIASAAIPWILKVGSRLRHLLWLATALLVIDSIARWVGADFDFGMAIEHSLQMIAPVSLILAMGPRPHWKRWSLLVGIAAAFTFIGHGFYAAGIHPVPLSYQNMTIAILGVSQSTALVFLSVAGWLDILFAIGLFLRRTRFLSLIYLVLWGGATACARVVAHFDLEAATWALNPWIFETAVRTPHWLLPFLLLFLDRDHTRIPGKTTKAGTE